jgi:hypothetical protein
MKAGIILVSIALILVGGGYFIFSSSVTEPTVNDANTATTEESTNVALENEVQPAEESIEEISSSEVAANNSEQSCWTIINDNVYDITEYIPRHPGGDEILLACGSDGTSLFFERQTENGQSIGSGTPHSSGATRQLDAYLIGTLAD